MTDQGHRRVFRDSRLEDAFTRDGYVVISLLTAPAADLLHKRLLKAVPPAAGAFFGPFREGDSPLIRARIDRLVRPVLARALEGVIVGQELFLGSALVKQPGPDGTIDLHLDSSFTADPRARAGVIWVALQDITDRGGALSVAPGSHRLGLPIQSLPPATQIIRHDDADLIGLVRSVPLSKGEAIVFDNRLVHGSPANVGDEPRVVAAVAFRAVGVRLSVFIENEPDQPQRLVLDDELLLRLDGDPATWLSHTLVGPDRTW